MQDCFIRTSGVSDVVPDYKAIAALIGHRPFVRFDNTQVYAGLAHHTPKTLPPKSDPQILRCYGLSN